MFREIHEIKNYEKITNDKNKELGYMKIKPKTEKFINMTDKQADNLIKEIFAKAAMEMGS